jgi:hypothetical protein
LPGPAAALAPPTPDPRSPQQHIFYGEVPPGGSEAPVLVFVHGVNGLASDWWAPPNDMYRLAFRAGYRTAFVSLSPDNTRNNAGILPNAAVFKGALRTILARLGARPVYVIAHSKGGVDVQAALLDSNTAKMVRAVFTVGSPHQGTELADWAFGPGQGPAAGLGLLTPAIAALQTSWMASLRQLADPLATALGIPYFTVAGSSYTTPPNPLTSQTGPVLASLTQGQPSDGIVTVARSRLPPIYAVDLGTLPANHFALALGSLVFPRINAQIRALDGSRDFERIATRGFSFDGKGNPLPGDRQNSLPWSTQWFKGKLYVGTGRAFSCVTTATSDAALGRHDYPPVIPDTECTPDPMDLPLAAEIWRFTPETGIWERVYQSPQDVPIEFAPDGTPTKFTARDIAFRGMAVFKENGPGCRERLYVGGISASSLFDTLPPYSSGRRFPGPRMLYTDDGTTWHAVPQTPGTFFGDIGVHTEAVKNRGFRSFVSLPDAHGKNRLFVTLSDLRGVGRVIASSNPSAGDDAWRQVSAPASELPIFTLYVYRKEIYATVGDEGYPNGYAVFKTDAATPDPADPTRYLFTPVVVGDGMQLFRPRGAISMQEFRGRLYVGTDRPTELIRINPDQSWDLVVGPPRMTASGLKRPLSGITGKGFSSAFNGHFYSMTVHDGRLYLGTWDWSQMLQGTPLHGLFRFAYGFDFFSSPDGIRWTILDRNGLGDPYNASIRNLESTPFGLFVGATNANFGLQMFWSRGGRNLDCDCEDDHDRSLAGRGEKGRHGRPRRCPAEPKGPPAPAQLRLALAEERGPKVVLRWSGVKEATQYHVYRADPLTLDDLVSPTTTITLPDGTTVTIEQAKNGALDHLCENEASEAGLCALIEALKSNTLGSKPFRWIGSTCDRTFVESPAGPVLYYVAAQDDRGRISPPTNVVEAPSPDEGTAGP